MIVFAVLSASSRATSAEGIRSKLNQAEDKDIRTYGSGAAELSGGTDSGGSEHCVCVTSWICIVKRELYGYSFRFLYRLPADYARLLQKKGRLPPSTRDYYLLVLLIIQASWLIRSYLVSSNSRLGPSKLGSHYDVPDSDVLTASLL
jgi:hypothetical protein